MQSLNFHAYDAAKILDRGPVHTRYDRISFQPRAVAARCQQCPSHLADAFGPRARASWGQKLQLSTGHPNCSARNGHHRSHHRHQKWTGGNKKYHRTQSCTSHSYRNSRRPCPTPKGGSRAANTYENIHERHLTYIILSWRTLEVVVTVMATSERPTSTGEDGRTRLKKMRMFLRLSHNRLDTEQALLLSKLKELGFNYSASKLRELIREYEDLDAARQRLRHLEQDYEEVEEKLYADELHLPELWSTSFDDSLHPHEPDFPAGWLDFTGDEPRIARSNASFASAPAESPPEKIEYDRCLDESDAWREKLLNLNSEHEQLTQQRAKRSRLGLALDSFSIERLEKYDAELEYISRGLDQAESSLEHAEVVWLRRKSTLEQMTEVIDPFTEVLSISPHTQPVTMTDDVSGQEDFFYELSSKNEALLEPQSDLAMNIVRILQHAEPETTPVFRVPSLHSNGQNVNMATFINQWLLQRIRQSPKETTRLANNLARVNPELTAEAIVTACIATWLTDSSEKEFFVAVEAGDHSFHESLAPNNGLVEILNDRATSQRLRLSPALRTWGRAANTDR